MNLRTWREREREGWRGGGEGERREKESERGERRCESRGKSILRFRMEKIMQCNNLIVHMCHVYVHSYMCVPMELSTDCKLHI